MENYSIVTSRQVAGLPPLPRGDIDHLPNGLRCGCPNTGVLCLRYYPIQFGNLMYELYRFGATPRFVPSSQILGSSLAGRQGVLGRSLASRTSQVLIIQSSRLTTGRRQPTWHLAFLFIQGKVLCPRLLRRAGKQARGLLQRVGEVLNIQGVLKSQAGSTFPPQAQRGRLARRRSIHSILKLKQRTHPFNTHLALKCWTKGLQRSLKTFLARECESRHHPNHRCNSLSTPQRGRRPATTSSGT